ncbi:MFS general substrate transporter [Ramaria rubella]|nr:MFS general substrate transporter [Ramaria rubella]
MTSLSKGTSGNLDRWEDKHVDVIDVQTDVVDEQSQVVDERALLRKMDWRFIPWCSFLYFLSFLDRTSIGNARLYGLEEDLHISDNQYLLTLTVFFISCYWAFEVPSNIFLKRLRPSFWLPLCMTAWGICMVKLLILRAALAWHLYIALLQTVQGLVHDFGGLITVRWFLGMLEAGFYPGVAYFFSCWYKRSEFGFRLAMFASMATVSGAFGGLLAAAISKIEGVGGKPGWAWIFILEGLVTIVAGGLSFWIIQDFPDTAKFLTDAERKFIIQRLHDDGQFSVSGETFQMKYVWESLKDRKTWLFMLLAAGYNGPLYAFSLFTPSIINQSNTPLTARSIGFTATPANLLSVPIYVFACALTCTVGYYADRVGNRGYFNLACLTVGMAGYIILIASRNAALSYFAIYLAAAGIFPSIANSATWYANNTEGSFKRGVTIAMAVGFGNLQGAITSNIYRARDTPWYTLGHAIQLAYITVGFVATTMLILLLRTENKRRERGERDEVIVSGAKAETMDAKRANANGVFESVEEARRAKGDMWSGYRYHL